MVPALALAFVSASAHATPDGLSAQAADEMHCNTVKLIQTSPTEYIATGCGRDRTYDCEDDGTCQGNVEGVTTSEERAEDDAAAEMVASALTDMACACASAGLAHGSHQARTSSNGTHHHHKKR